MLCSPKDLKYLAVGFLAAEGFLSSKDEIKKIMVDNQRGVVRVETVADKGFAQDALFKRLITSGCGRGASFYSAADAADRLQFPPPVGDVAGAGLLQVGFDIVGLVFFKLIGYPATNVFD